MMSVQTLKVPEDLAQRVEDAEYARLLGYPSLQIQPGTARQRADEARRWYRRHGTPWAFTRTVAIERLEARAAVLADGRRLASELLAERLRSAATPAVVIAAVSAGSEVDERTDLLWLHERQQEAYYLDRFGAALVEHLSRWVAETLRATAGAQGLAVLPGYSPGYDGWDLAQQTIVAASLLGDCNDLPLGPFEVLSSGMMTPRSSLLSVFGLTPRVEIAERAWARRRCTWCSFAGCSLRRGRVAPDDGEA